jgi:hypothetical protein
VAVVLLFTVAVAACGSLGKGRDEEHSAISVPADPIPYGQYTPVKVTITSHVSGKAHVALGLLPTNAGELRNQFWDVDVEAGVPMVVETEARFTLTSITAASMCVRPYVSLAAAIVEDDLP